MNRKISLAIVFGLAIGSAHAMQTATYEIRALSADPNPVGVKSGPATVRLTIDIKPMGSLGMSTDPCEADIDFGNGTVKKNQLLGVDGKVRSVFEARYDKPGTYTIRVAGSPGLRACDSSKKLVIEAGDFIPEAAPAAVPKAVKKDTPLQPSMINVSCPPGWAMVPGSQYGTRFTCHIAPPPTIQCEQGTTYFATENSIGCK